MSAGPPFCAGLGSRPRQCLRRWFPLAGAKKSDLARGDTIAKPGSVRKSLMLDVGIRRFFSDACRTNSRRFCRSSAMPSPVRAETVWMGLKFIKNMLAGAGGIDLAMLVVAADEGFMPQPPRTGAPGPDSFRRPPGFPFPPPGRRSPGP